MKNKDIIQAKKVELFQRMNKAVSDDDQEQYFQALEEFQLMIQEAVIDEAKGIIQSNDSVILSGRGVRQLTSEENQYYQKLADAMRSSNPKQALTELDVVMPKTIIDAVFEDLQKNHPLLDKINFQNTSGLIEFLVNTHQKQPATWGTLTAEIVKEITSGFKKINMQLNKLSAFIPVSKSMLDLGPAWLDRYVRIILTEAIYDGLEEAVTNGTGKDMPIGMNRQVGDGVTVTDGVYPLKETVVMTEISPGSYGTLLAVLAENPNGDNRAINEVTLIVNPVDYLTKVMPATTIQKPDGTYSNNNFPIPTEVIQSGKIPSNRAILGLPKRYFMGVGTQKSGKIEYSDEYKFLEDQRIYLTKLYGHGQPLDNTAFIYLDIENLKPNPLNVKVTNPDEFPGGADF